MNLSLGLLFLIISFLNDIDKDVYPPLPIMLNALSPIFNYSIKLFNNALYLALNSETFKLI